MGGGEARVLLPLLFYWARWTDNIISIMIDMRVPWTLFPTRFVFFCFLMHVPSHNVSTFHH